MKAFCILLTHQSVNYFYALNAYDAITNVIPVYARKFACTSFHIGGFLVVWYGHKASWDFLAAYFWFCWLLMSFPLHHLFYIALSSPWFGKRVLVNCCLSVSLYTCMLPHLCLPIRLHAKGNMWFMKFTLHHHHCSFITDTDLTHNWYTNLLVYKNKEARQAPTSNVWIWPWNMQSNKLSLCM